MNRWQLNQVFAILLTLLFAYMFVTSSSSGESKSISFGYLVWAGISVALFIWARRKDKEVKLRHKEDIGHIKDD
ncbi:MAG TPA: hypothetical protein VFW52_02595 [Candidatus Saccharimonadales bacterium]|nr:hypothetical protein [Candidatus Saccharimonadales bacterium]